MSKHAAFETTPGLQANGVTVGVMGSLVLVGTTGPRGKFATMNVADARDLGTLLGAAIREAEAGARVLDEQPGDMS